MCDISIIIPVYERTDLLLRHTLPSIERAVSDLSSEVIVVDDGSPTSVESQLDRSFPFPLRVVRQDNQGYLFARERGREEAKGEFIQFLDSDDLVSEQKFFAQVQAMKSESLDVSYTDQAEALVEEGAQGLTIKPGEPSPETSDPAELFLRVHPIPHSAIFRRGYLREHLSSPMIPKSPIFSVIGDVWMNYNLVPYPARIRKVADEAFAIKLAHEANLSGYWERLGIASTALALAFMERSQRDEGSRAARTLLGELSFATWRRLPKNFSGWCEAKRLEIWRQAPKGARENLGGSKFVFLSRLLGPELAGRVMRSLQAKDYGECRTLERAEVDRLIAQAQNELKLMNVA